MDLSTHYLGFELPHPFMPGASPLVDDLDTVRRLEDCGAPMIVMHSLFEEQLVGEQIGRHLHYESTAHSSPEALDYFPEPVEFRLGPEEYLEQLRKIKQTVSVPVVASLNGTTLGGWLEFSRLIEEAGADALELNVYDLVSDFEATAEGQERETVAMVKRLAGEVGIPLAIKLSPFYTAFANFARELDRAGADALVLFNRFYQPDIDVEELDVARSLRLSDSSELNLRLRWLATLAGRVDTDLAVTGGVHESIDALKAIMCGADAVQLVSVLLRNGVPSLERLRRGLAEWLEEHGYDSLAQARGSMSLERCPDPRAFERANYLHLLESWREPA